MFVVALLLLLSALTLYLVQHPRPRPDLEAKRQRVEQAINEADHATTVVMAQRDLTRQVSRREREAAATLRQRLKTTDDSLKALTETLVDSTATMAELRRSLSQAIETTDTLIDTVTAYMAAVDSLKDAYAAERRAATVAIEKAEKTIVLQDQLIRALQTQECRILGIRCPNRTEVFLVGASVGLIASLLTIR